MANKVSLLFDGISKECVLSEDKNGEYLFIAEDGSFVKFPAEGDVKKAIEAHNASNAKKVELNVPVQYGQVITFDKDGNEVKVD